MFWWLFLMGVVWGFFNAAYLLRYCSPVRGREVGARVLGVLSLGTGAQAFFLLFWGWRGGDGFLLGGGVVGGGAALGLLRGVVEVLEHLPPEALEGLLEVLDGKRGG